MWLCRHFKKGTQSHQDMHRLRVLYPAQMEGLDGICDTDSCPARNLRAGFIFSLNEEELLQELLAEKNLAMSAEIMR